MRRGVADGVIGGDVVLCGVMLPLNGVSCWLSKCGGAVGMLGGCIAVVMCPTGLWCLWVLSFCCAVSDGGKGPAAAGSR